MHRRLTLGYSRDEETRRVSVGERRRRDPVTDVVQRIAAQLEFIAGDERVPGIASIIERVARRVETFGHMLEIRQQYP